MHLVYAKDDLYDGWVFWKWDAGWGDLEDATVYDLGREPICLEGEPLYVEDLEEAMYAEYILDILEVLEEHEDTNLASPAGRRAIASWLVSRLASQGKLAGADTDSFTTYS